MSPDEIEKRVSVGTWQRWLVWMTAKASHEVWQIWRQPGEKNFDAAQQKLFNWPVGEGY